MMRERRFPDTVILGSTGSVGEQAIDVAIKHNIKVTALAAHRNYKRVEQQARALSVPLVAMTDEAAARELRVRVKNRAITSMTHDLENVLREFYERQAVSLANQLSRMDPEDINTSGYMEWWTKPRWKSAPPSCKRPWPPPAPPPPKPRTAS